jgi:hypothetical protein
MMPRPPARDTAEASWVRAIQPIGACTMGYLAPVWARTRFMAVYCCEGETGGRFADDAMASPVGRQSRRRYLTGSLCLRVPVGLRCAGATLE